MQESRAQEHASEKTEEHKGGAAAAAANDSNADFKSLIFGSWLT